MKKLVSVIAALSIVFSGAVSPVFAAQALRLDDESLDSVVAGQVEENTLTLEDQAQRFFKGLSNANTVDSANAVQSSVISALAGDSDLTNDADVYNIDGYSASGVVENTLVLKDDVQSGEEDFPPGTAGDDFFAALSNLNTVDSSNAVQSNIIVAQEAGSVSSASNSAYVWNGDGLAYGIMDTDNYLRLQESAQKNLWAVSNLNTVDSANAVQSNITVSLGGGATSNSSNYADVENWSGWVVYNPQGPNTKTTNNTLSIVGNAQEKLIALSNLNTVDSANAVQSNMSFEGATNTSSNEAYVTNADGLAPQGGKIITNTLEIKGKAQHNLTALSNLNAVGSASAVQSNITTAHCHNQSTNTADVHNYDGYYGMYGVTEYNEALSLGDDVQGGLVALSNINTVDSANAVQSNITVNDTTDYTPGAVNNTSSNIATVLNEDSDPAEDGGDNSIVLKGSAQNLLIAGSNVNTIDSANAVQSNITVNTVGTGATTITNESTNEAGSITITGSFPSYTFNAVEDFGVQNLAGYGDNSLVLDESAQINLIALSNLTAVSSASAVQSNITNSNIGGTVASVSNASWNKATVKNLSGTGDNTLKLKDDAQKELAALSNINTVDSANAVQSNITTSNAGLNLSGEPTLQVGYGYLPIPGTSAVIVYPDEVVFNLDNIFTLPPADVDATTNVSVNAAIVTDSSGDSDGSPDLLKIEGSAQKDLTALSNLTTVGSANAVQSNITVSAVDGACSDISVNLADVENAYGTGEDRLVLKDNAQEGLMALSNLNTVESANAVQSNITVGGSKSGNVANVRNLEKDPSSEKVNFLKLSGAAQQNLVALSNVNAVCSATAVQSNITVSSGTGISYSANYATVTNGINP